MKFVLIAVLCSYSGLFAEKCEPVEIAVFESRAECEKAIAASAYNNPVCGVKP